MSTRKTSAKPARTVSRPAAKKAEIQPASPRPAAKKAATNDRRMLPPKSGVAVRMYRTGLGDCFLLGFSKARGKRKGTVAEPFYILIDCGVFKGTPGAGQRIPAIVEDIRLATNPDADGSGQSRVDVLIITHEHWDHISAFSAQARANFAVMDAAGAAVAPGGYRIEPLSLWMAWTEDPEDELAQKIKAEGLAEWDALGQAFGAMGGPFGAAGTEAHGLIEKVLGFFGDVPDAVPAFGAAPKPSRQSSEAMTWIRDVYAKDRPRAFHLPGDGPIELDVEGGARVYVLGPPRDEQLLKILEKTGTTYGMGIDRSLAAACFTAFGVMPPSDGSPPSKDDFDDSRRMSLPFDEFHQVAIDEARADPFYQEHYFQDHKAEADRLDPKQDWRRIDFDWAEPAADFALQLDSKTNNTSLAFALELGKIGEGPVLLFPGDAQVGNWLSWFGTVEHRGRTLGKDLSWQVEGRREPITARDLLGRTVFYKVGHHGSHNATLRDLGLEIMGKKNGGRDLVAMIPVDEFVAHAKAGYGSMPLPDIVKELLVICGGRVLRNDMGDDLHPPDTPTLGGIAGAPAALETFDGLVVDDSEDSLYVEYRVGP